MQRITLLLLVALALFGCSHIPLTTMWQLKDTDLLSVDPQYLKILIRLPTEISMEQTVVNMQLGFHPEDSETPERVEFYPFTISKNQRIPVWIETQRKSDEEIYRMELDTAQSARYTEMQAWLKNKNSENIKAKKSFGVHVSHFCLINSHTRKPLLSNIYLSMQPEENFITLMKDIRLDTQDFDWNKALCKTEE